MNPTVKQKLVSALRSGDYKQTRGQLRDDDSFCVLGVLCDLYVKEHPDKAEWVGNNIITNPFDTSQVLPKAIQLWSGLEVNGMTLITIEGETKTFSAHNDGFYYGDGIEEDETARTSLEIADAVEEQC